MLRFLSISRLAIIDALSVEFPQGFIVLTGETGAGKSIVVGAIDLLLGGRASSDLVRAGADSAVVQACLETIDNKELIIRREISGTGRSRAFLDETLVSAASLREVTGPLVDLHGQHDHQQLLDPAQHLRLLDVFAGSGDDLAAVAACWDRLLEARGAVDALSMGQRERETRLEVARFQLAEIDRVGPTAGEDDALGAERQVLANAERLHRLVREAYADLYEDDGAALARLGRMWKRLEEGGVVDPTLDPGDARRQVQPVLEDLAVALRDYLGHLDTSPERLQEVEDRLAAIERLKRRHGPGLDEVLARAGELRATVALLETTAERGDELRTALASAERAYRQAAARLSARRAQAARRLPDLLERELADLAMERTRCVFPLESDLDRPDRWTASGADRGELFISANAGEPPRPLARIASGGELSRVMLALKTVACSDGAGKTLIFDEVDAGISGRVADSVGRRLRELGQRFQVICITHLPQVAAHASAHFHVSKRSTGERTAAEIRQLDEVGRVEELARLIAGRDVTDSARSAARDMLASAAGRRPQGESESKGKTKGESESRRPVAKERRGA